MNIIKKIIEGVPDYNQFMSVAELNESSKQLRDTYPDLVELLEIGTSKDGEPICALKIGSGNKKALLYGFPHPNEPVGSVMLDHLSWKLAENEEFRNVFDFTWYIVKVADVEGAKLNEGWFKNPYSFREYVYNYYRPAGNEQVEWSFPIEYKSLKFDKPIPETKALMKIVEEAKPDFIYSLHNAGFGGVYYYITEEAHILYPIYEKAAKDRNVPLSLGEPEVAYAKKLDEAVFIMPTTEDSYDYYEKYSNVDPANIIMSGECSFGYARKLNPKLFELVCEVPYYYDERVQDTKETDCSRRELVLASLNSNHEDMQTLKGIFEQVKSEFSVRTKFQDALEYFIEVSERSFDAAVKWAKTAEELNRNATISEKFDSEFVNKSYGLFKWGMLYRMIMVNYEVNKDPILAKTAEKVKALIDERIEKLEQQMNFNVIPIRKLVQIQLTAGLYSALYVQGR